MKKIFILCLGLMCFASLTYAANINQIAAVVNGRMISSFDVQQQAEIELKKAGIDVKKSSNNAQTRAIIDKALDNMILELIIVDAAEKASISASPSEVDGEIKRMMQSSGLNKEQFEKRLREDGLSVSALQKKISSSIVRQKLMSVMVGRKVLVEPEAVRAYYDSHPSEFTTKESLELALLVYPDNVDAVALDKRIKKHPEKFEIIAKQISLGPNKAGGGHLGPVDLTKLPQPLVALIKKLSVGQTSPILMLNGKRSQFKLVKYEKGGKLLPYSEAEPMAKQIVREPLLKERFDDYIQQLRSKAVVDIRI